MNRDRLRPESLFAILGIAACVVLATASCDNGPDPVAPNLSAPQCSLSTAALDFGTVEIGQSAQRTFRITNTGGGTLSGTVSETCADYSVVGVNTFNLGAGLAQTFTLRYTPTSEGASSCALQVGTSCAPIAMSGVGEAETCLVTPGALDFGTILPGESARLDFTIQNVGSGTLTGTVSETCADFRVISPVVTYNLGPGQAHTFTVEFTPTTAGTQTCEINTGSPACGSVMAIGGTSTACLVSTTSIDFGTVPPSAPDPTETFTITNPGSGRLTGRLTFNGLDCGPPLDPNFEIVGLDTFDIGPGESQNFTVRFSPNAYGTFTCVLDTGLAECEDIQLRGVKI